MDEVASEMCKIMYQLGQNVLLLNYFTGFISVSMVWERSGNTATLTFCKMLDLYSSY